MLLAKVTGNVVATQKNSYLKGHKLLIIQKIDLEGNLIGKKDVIALDFVNSGIGDTVLVVQEGQAVQQILGHKKTPVHSVIVAVVDEIDIKINT
ncbi:MAG: EutN/CcmL family microcompartment protein [Bacteroidetes bacterium]|nr:EutN/CcmL family microcompartment protein [Bacteroidota bacterium]MCH8325686.1 EutN/CcmL family microcompartment protein [Bacteroidota bacterium]